MAFALNLTVRFIGDRYHGNEWPPSPARLFQALVAGAKTGAPVREWNAARHRALEWLESLSPPDIFFRPKYDGNRYTIYVPNNSLDEGQSTKTSKQVAPTILVDHSPGEPDVIYRWHVADADGARVHLPALDQLAAVLRALGWGIDFAAALASLDEDPPSPKGLELFTPGAHGGISSRVPQTGLPQGVDRQGRFVSRLGNDAGRAFESPGRSVGMLDPEMRRLPRRWQGMYQLLVTKSHTIFEVYVDEATAIEFSGASTCPSLAIACSHCPGSANPHQLH